LIYLPRLAAILIIITGSLCAAFAATKYQNSPAPQAQQTPSTPTQSRARAYAKVLEGQRHLVHFRGGEDNNLAVLARQAFQEAVKLDPTLAEAHTALAQLAFYYPPQDLDAAAIEAVNATKIDPDNFGAHQILSRLYTIKSGLREGTLNEAFATLAIKELKEVGRLDKNSAESWALLGELYDATKRSAEALDAWTHWAAAPQPSDVRFFQYITNSDLTTDAAYARLGLGLLTAQRLPEALQAIRKAVRAEPENRNYLLLLNRAFEADGNRDADTVSDLQRIVAANPANILATQILAQIESRRGHWQEAVKLLRSQLKGTPVDFASYLAISAAYSQGGQSQDALAAARKALELAPAEEQAMVTAALFVLSSAQERSGDMPGAEESLRRILAKEPDNPTALNNLGYFLTERNQRLPEALDMIRRAVKAEPANASFLDSLGWVYFKLGQLKEAETNLSEAARVNATSPTIHEHLGEIYFARNEVTKARAAWEKALTLSIEPEQTARLKARLSSQTK
jgi:tetratricopeptide (TPR) repeat protein